MNENVEHSLDAYLNSENPPVPYAMLLDGPWGSGKTYFLKNIYEIKRRERLRQDKKSDPKYLYVSLFGAKSAKDVEIRLYKAYDYFGYYAGKLSTEGINWITQWKSYPSAKKILDHAGNIAIKRLGEVIIIFDDVERTDPHAFNEIMGLINELVADNTRVILVADEQQLKTNTLWQEQNEKFVGRRVTIQADIRSVINNCIKKVSNNNNKKFLSDNTAYIEEIATLSDVKNLRNLSWAIHNASIFSEYMLEDTDIPPEHVKRTVGVVLASTLWLRSKYITDEILLSVPNKYFNKSIQNDDVEQGKQQKTAHDFISIFEKISVHQPPVDYQFITKFESTGVLNKSDLTDWVKRQFGFGSGYEEPSWRQVWFDFERPRVATNAALINLECDLASRKYKSFEEILHCAGIAIKQEEYGYQKLTNGVDTVTYFKQYIDNISQEGLLKEIDKFNNPFYHESALGLGYQSRQTSQFKEILEYYSDVSKIVAKNNLLSQANEILEKAENGNISAIMEFVYNDNHNLTQEPILKEFDPARVANLLSTDMPELEIGTRLLSFRYNRANHSDQLFEEISWAREVYLKIIENISKWDSPFNKIAESHIRIGITHYEKNRLPEHKIIQ